ncbi:hypothetical protein [Algiphilus sp.]|uniref:hypothetical protein n=1 Tax=Algiphilus sp. TaxID=1872431 RepID=UPI003B518C6E
MHKLIYALATSAACGLVSLPAHADPLDGLEMDVIGIDERPEAASRRIELPEAADRRQAPAKQDPPPGLDTANEARDRVSDLGQQTAEQAREGAGPPDDIGQPDNPGEQGNRPDDAGPPDDSGRPAQPGDGTGNRPDDAGPAERPQQPNDDRPSDARTEPPATDRPDSEQRPRDAATPAERPDHTSIDSTDRNARSSVVDTPNTERPR